MNAKKFMCWVLGLALVFGLLPMANLSYADEQQGLQDWDLWWSWLNPAGHVSDPNTHVLIVNSSPGYFPVAKTFFMPATIRYSSSSDKVTVGANGELRLVSTTDLPTDYVTITATAEASGGYRETSISYKLYVKNYFEPRVPQNIIAVDAEAGQTGKITGTTSAMEYVKVMLGYNREEPEYRDCADGETTGLAPGKYFVRYKETATHHHDGRYLLVHIKTKDAEERTLKIVDSEPSKALEETETYYAGDEVVIAPGFTNSRVFQGWTVGDGVTLTAVGGGAVDLTAVPLSFVMPNQDVTLTANWQMKQRKFQYLRIDNSEKKYHKYVVGGVEPMTELMIRTDELSDVLSYALKEPNTQGISVDAKTGALSVEAGLFKQSTKVVVVVSATDYQGSELNSDEFTYYVKPVFPISEHLREHVQVKQPTKAGEKGVVTGASALEYSLHASGQYTDYTPVGDEPLELAEGEYLFRYKEQNIETDPFFNGYEGDLIRIAVPSPDSNNSGSEDGNLNNDFGASDTSSESSSDTSSSASTSATTEPAPKAEVKTVGNTEDKRVVAAVAAETKVSGTEVKGIIAATAVEQAVVAAEKAISSGKKAGVQIEVKTAKNTESMSVSLPTAALKTVTESKAENITVTSGLGNITIDKNTLSSIAKQSKGNVTLSVEKAETKLNRKQKEAIGDAPVYDINLTSGDTKIKSFDGGKLTISLPYTVKEGKNPNDVVVWYVDDLGNIEKMETVYDEASKAVVFKTTHLSKYAIGYENKTEQWKNPFADIVETAWYYDAVKFVTEKAMMYGTSETTFDPTMGVTRGMLVTVLHRLEGTPESQMDSAFADVDPKAYYANAVKWAAQSAIVKGVGENKFAPDALITREEIAVILYNYAAFKKRDVAVSSEGASANLEGVSSWALEAMKWSTANGIFQGNAEGSLMPKATATRAELAKVLKGFVELAE